MRRSHVIYGRARVGDAEDQTWKKRNCNQKDNWDRMRRNRMNGGNGMRVGARISILTSNQF